MPAETNLTHSFSRAQAKQYGVHAALLLRYLTNRIKNSTNSKDGKRWFYDSLAALKENYPYLSQTAVNNARRALIKDNGPLITANYNKWPKDKTTWYAVRDDRTLNSPEDDLLYFWVWEAAAYGILEAVIMNNLRYWLAEKQKENPQHLYHPVSPRRLQEVFQGAFSFSSIRRALQHLVRAGVLIPKNPESANDPILFRYGVRAEVTG